MNKLNHIDKKDLAYVYSSVAEYYSKDKETSCEFLISEGVNTERLVSEGLKRIKKMQLLVNAKRTEQEMIASEHVKSAAIEWVDQLLNDIDFSLPELVQKEKLSMSFRNVEKLSKEDIRNILIRHFVLKLTSQQNNEQK